MSDAINQSSPQRFKNSAASTNISETDQLSSAKGSEKRPNPRVSYCKNNNSAEATESSVDEPQHKNLIKGEGGDKQPVNRPIQSMKAQNRSGALENTVQFQERPKTPKNLAGAVMLCIKKGSRYCYELLKARNPEEGLERTRLDFLIRYFKGIPEDVRRKFFRFIINKYDDSLCSWYAIIAEVMKLKDETINRILKDLMCGLFADENEADFDRWLMKTKLKDSTKEFLRDNKKMFLKEFLEDFAREEDRQRRRDLQNADKSKV